jgi:hypothetical protein
MGKFAHYRPRARKLVGALVVAVLLAGLAVWVGRY